MFVWEGDDDLDAGVGEGAEDGWVGVVELDLGDGMRLEELCNFGG